MCALYSDSEGSFLLEGKVIAMKKNCPYILKGELRKEEGFFRAEKQSERLRESEREREGQL
jgi:hypothetical protein